MTEYELFKALRPLYPAAEYALLPQVANGTGSHARRHADAIAVSLWPSRGIHVTGFEMKSYRGDFLREIANPAKAEEIAEFCHFWYIVAGGPFIAVEEVPHGWGLMIWEWENKDDPPVGKLVVKKKAPLKEATPMSVMFIAAVLRQAQNVVAATADIEEARAAGFKSGKAEGESRSGYAIHDLAEIQKKLAVIKKKTGINLSDWRPAEDIADAVDCAINGKAQQHMSALRRIATKITSEFGAETETD